MKTSRQPPTIIAKCALCLGSEPLVNSHVIPKFFYKPLRDEKGRFERYPLKKGVKPLQDGLKEPLLCGQCEQHLANNFETYSIKVLNNPVGLPCFIMENTSNIPFLRIGIADVDYKKFRLFQLSILWRASVSTLPDFSEVNLGKHEEILRKMIRDVDSGSPDLYPVWMLPIKHEGDVLETLVIPPMSMKLYGYQAYRFTFGGMVWIYFVSSHKVPQMVRDLSISPSGLITLVPMNLKDIDFIMDIVESHIR